MDSRLRRWLRICVVLYVASTLQLRLEQLKLMEYGHVVVAQFE